MNHSVEQLAGLPSTVHAERRLAIIVTGTILGGLAMYWFGSLLLIAAMWLIVVIALAVAAYSGYLASQTTETIHRNGLSVTCGAAVVGAIVVWWLIPSATSASRATWTYWAELSRIDQQGEAFNAKTGEPTTLAAAAAALKQAAKSCEQMAGAISDLPTLQVDPVAVELGAAQVQVLHEISLIMGDMRSLIEQDQALLGASTSIPVFVESFIRGMLGDPFGTARELAAAGQQLGGKQQQLQQRLTIFQQKIVALSAQEVRVRSTLSQKYGREFPPLTPQHARRN